MEKPDFKKFPPLPGVYLFKDMANLVIYVGKAKSLRNRIRSYFANKTNDWKIKALLQEGSHIEHILTYSEAEALLLETKLIQEQQPKFNVLLKSGQPFVYLLFTKKDLPELKLVRNRTEKGVYFGPFLYKKQARAVWYYLQKTFRLTLCTKKMANGCLNFHLGLCAGNCRDVFNNEDYLLRIHLAQEILRGNYTRSLQAIKNQIMVHNKKLEFEKARNLAYYLENIDTIFNTLKTHFTDEKYAREIFVTTAPVKELKVTNTVLQELQELLGMDKLPVTIDCFDISHFQSREIVGSCVRFTNGKPDKNNFRRFKIKTLDQQNDYAALREIVGRRYRDPKNLPDLVMIDGGKGQLSAVIDLLPNTECISLAKREEMVYSQSLKANQKLKDGLPLNIHTNAGKLLIALRDYTHHFAIEYHKKRQAMALRDGHNGTKKRGKHV